jgi:ABC-type amino acid transport substrate-binding protein
VATQKTVTELRDSIDKALMKLGETGALQEFAQRYGIPFHKPFDTTYSLAEMQKLN